MIVQQYVGRWPRPRWFSFVFLRDWPKQNWILWSAAFNEGCYIPIGTAICKWQPPTKLVRSLLNTEHWHTTGYHGSMDPENEWKYCSKIWSKSCDISYSINDETLIEWHNFFDLIIHVIVPYEYRKIWISIWIKLLTRNIITFWLLGV